MRTITKTIAVVLVCTLCLQLMPITSFAQSISPTDLRDENDNIIGTKSNESVCEFIDSEDKVNRIHVVKKDGIVTVNGYIDGELIAVSTVSAQGNDYVITENVKGKVNTYKINNVDVKNLSDDIQNMALQPASYSLVGTIKYKPYITPYGTYYYKLKVYHEQTGSDYGTYTLNAEKGALLSTLVGILCTALDVLTSGQATNIIRSIVIGIGGSIVGGQISKAFTETIATYSYKYNVKANDPDTGRNCYYTGKRHRALASEYYDETYYEGYMPYNSTTVAYWMYCDFWDGNSYPGVESF